MNHMNTSPIKILWCAILLFACGVSVPSGAQTAEQVAKAREHQRKGETEFKAGNFKGAIEEWDKVIELIPAQEPYHWQRGIAYYYAGEFAKGVRQFESHQKVNSADVENAVWHFICLARQSGLEEARRKLIPIEGDTRVPMMEVHALFAGKSTPEKVLAAARAGSPSPEELKNRLCYAHLYLGLYAEAQGKKKEALDHIRQAAVDYSQPHYMGEVARVHLRHLQKE